ncbi:MAG: hypothetical protein OIF32_01775 [Campylobacterales bacterium]|nr:hypothetical protein [Campylobacterales bacterium]
MFFYLHAVEDCSVDFGFEPKSDLPVRYDGDGYELESVPFDDCGFSFDEDYIDEKLDGISRCLFPSIKAVYIENYSFSANRKQLELIKQAVEERQGTLVDGYISFRNMSCWQDRIESILDGLGFGYLLFDPTQNLKGGMYKGKTWLDVPDNYLWWAVKNEISVWKNAKDEINRRKIQATGKGYVPSTFINENGVLKQFEKELNNREYQVRKVASKA